MRQTPSPISVIVLGNTLLMGAILREKVSFISVEHCSGRISNGNRDGQDLVGGRT
jgi:hypothetical protein